MIKNYLKIALRNFGRHKLFTFINIIGLSIGISAALVIYLIVSYDFSFDKFHQDGDRIYRVVSNYTFSGEPASNSGVTAPLPEAIRHEVPGVVTTAHFFTLDGFEVKVPQGSSKADKRFKSPGKIILADANYFDIFKYKWLVGSPKTSLTAPYKVVVTEERGQMYYPGLTPEELIGKTITYEDSIHAEISGVVASFKQNTDLSFQEFVSFATNQSSKGIRDNVGVDLINWGSTTSASQCFVKLSPNADSVTVEHTITSVYLKHNPPKAEDKGNKTWYLLQPLSDLHFNAKYGNFDGDHLANKNTLTGLLVVAAFLLVLGCINFINLTTAQASQRSKEIGIRKTIGSTRNQLIAQLLSETFIITSIAVIISLLASPLILKLFSDLISPDVKLDLMGHPGIMAFLFVLTVVVSILSGFYPAMVLSGFKPVVVLKSQSAVGSGKTRNIWLRKSLTITQFIIAQFFIMATILVSKQVHYALSKDLGFKKDAIIFASTPWKNNTESKKQVFADKLAAIPGVELVSRGSAPPSSGNTNSTDATYKDGKREVRSELYLKNADSNYIKLYGLKLLAGRNIRPSDTSRAFVINETYARIIGFKHPTDALGKTITKFNGNQTMQIVGVVKDFYQGSLHTPIKPIAVVMHGKWNNGTIHIALKPQSPGGEEWKATIAAIGKVWKEIYPDDDFSYQFYDESIAKFYELEQHVSKLLTWAAALSIFISCLGLLGLAMYTTNTRKKEIGVRKVLGATVSQIVTLLSRELIVLVVLAFVVVTPIAFLSMRYWMQNFADRTSISWWIFALSGGCMLITAFLTLSSQTIRAALSNPVKSLRSE